MSEQNMDVAAMKAEIERLKGLVKAAKAKSKGIVAIKSYTPTSNGKVAGMFLSIGTWGNQLFLRLNDGNAVTAEGKAKAQEVLAQLEAVVKGL